MPETAEQQTYHYEVETEDGKKHELELDAPIPEGDERS